MSDIAIIGLAGRFPQSPDVYTFWNNILNKASGVSDPPPEAWDMDAVYEPGTTRPNRIYTRKGGFLGNLATFNPLKHAVTPNAVAGTEPAQWLALEIAREAFDHAGYGAEIPNRERTAVILGRGTYINRGNATHYQHGSLIDETLALIAQLRPDLTAEERAWVEDDLRQQLPPFDATSAQGLIPNIIAGRIANKLDLMGPAYTVDAACAASVVALEQAVRGLRYGAFDMALVGGSYIVSPAPMAMVFAQLRVLSRSGKISPFSAESDGTVLGEGIGMVVLKRLADALRDDDPVVAVIKGVGTASDGSGKSVIAPRFEGAAKAMQRAFADAAVDPTTVGLVEAHGLGTAMGDSVEFAALAQTYAGSERPIALGTVKPMTGHLMPASGVAGLIKAALALHEGVLPPTLNVDRPNPELGWQQSPLYLNGTLQPWKQSDEAPRRAAVNSFGFGGVTAHVVLEQAPVGAKRTVLRPTYDAAERGRIALQTNTRTLTLSRDLLEKLDNRRAKQANLRNMPPIEQLPAAETVVTRGEKQMSNGVNPLAPAMMAAYTDLMKTFLNVQRDVMIAALNGSADASQLMDTLGPAALDYTPPAPAPMPEPVVVNGYTNGNGYANGNGYHNGSGNGYHAVATAPPAPMPVVVAPPSPAPVVEAVFEPVVAAPTGAVTAEAIEQALVSIVAERTGYPAEMIELDLDLEADLGIDSIKRVEILGSFQKQFGDAVSGIDMDDLTEKKSLQEIIDLVVG